MQIKDIDIKNCTQIHPYKENGLKSPQIFQCYCVNCCIISENYAKKRPLTCSLSSITAGFKHFSAEQSFIRNNIYKCEVTFMNLSSL